MIFKIELLLQYDIKIIMIPLHIKMASDKKYRLYALDSYKKFDEFINNGFIEYFLDDLIEELENDKGYHMRIDPEKNYIFFGDCDMFNGTFDEFAELLIGFLKQHYNINVLLNEISYTKNEGIEGS